MSPSGKFLTFVIPIENQRPFKDDLSIFISVFTITTLPKLSIGFISYRATSSLQI